MEFIRENPLQGEPVPRSGRQGVGKNESDPLSNKTEKQKVKTLFKIFPSPSELAEAFAEDNAHDIWNQPNEVEEESDTPAFLRRRRKHNKED